MKRVLTIGLLFFITFQIYPQESLLKNFRENFQKRYFSIGVYLQTIGDFQFERNLSGENGFILSNARVKFYGEFDEGFGYYLQTNFVNTRPVLDVFMYHKFSDLVRLDIGQFKAPFSGEYLTSSSAIDFVNRSQGTSSLPPKRQVGLQLRGTFAEGFNYAAGVFNGNGINARNDNNYFLYSGRLTFSPKISDAKLVIGGNTAFSKDEINGNTFDRLLFGGDFRLETSYLIFSGEFIQHKLENDELNFEDKDNGYHLTAGYKINNKLQILARYDVLNYVELDEMSKLIIAGLNYFPTEITRFQFNYVINNDDSVIKHNQILLKAQLAF